MSIEAYAQALFDHWGIGSQDRNYGILVLVSYLDRRARIEFGAGFANRYNAEAEAIMQDIIVPAFMNAGTIISCMIASASALYRLAKPAPNSMRARRSK